MIPVTWLSWNSARLLALILNALTGLLQFYERDHTELNVDGVFGLRLIQGSALTSMKTGSEMGRKLLMAANAN